MKYSTERKFKKYVKGYGFLYFARKFDDEYGRKLRNTATKTGIDTAKTASRWVAQKTEEAIEDLIGNKVADKTTSLGKTKSKGKEDRRREIYIPPEKQQQIIDDLRLFWYHIKMEYQKVTNLLGTTTDNAPTFITKKWTEVHDQWGSKQIGFKTSMLQSDLCYFSDTYIIVKGTFTVTNPNQNVYDKKLAFKNNARFVSCISRINNTLIDNAENLDIVMSLYKLLEYRKNYWKTTGRFWNYYKDKKISGANNNINYSINRNLGRFFRGLFWGVGGCKTTPRSKTC